MLGAEQTRAPLACFREQRVACARLYASAARGDRSDEEDQVQRGTDPVRPEARMAEATLTRPRLPLTTAVRGHESAPSSGGHTHMVEASDEK